MPKTPRHPLVLFVSLGLCWGASQPMFKAMSNYGVTPSAVIFWTGIFVGLGLMLLTRLHGMPLRFTGEISRFGFVCAFLINAPFALNLYLEQYVQPSELALIISTAPLFSFALALFTRKELAVPRKLLAVALGFAASALLIVRRGGGVSGEFSFGLVASFIIPMLYTLYNWYANNYWPKSDVSGRDAFMIGAAESLWSALIISPVFLFRDAPWLNTSPQITGYVLIGLVSLLWIGERALFFTLIHRKGALYTIQAVYIATPAAVIISILIYGDTADTNLALALALVMTALWLNNSGALKAPVTD